MKAILKENITGEEACYLTEVEIYQQEKLLYLSFIAHSSKLFSFSSIDNDSLYRGDVVEAFIDLGIINHYYEVEIAPNGARFFADVFNDGKNRSLIMLSTKLIQSKVTLNQDSYQVEVVIDLNKLDGDAQKLKYNLFRIDTDGGIESDRHLFALNPTLSASFHCPECFIDLLK